MDNTVGAVEEFLTQLQKAAKKVASGRSKQVTQTDAIDYLKSVAYTWFKTHRPVLATEVAVTSLRPVDEQMQGVLDATSRASARTTYSTSLHLAKVAVVALRSAVLTVDQSRMTTTDPAPDFAPLTSDATMQTILTRRWDECQRCLKAEAALAATVMMGGFLEALFVGRANQLTDKSPLFRAKATPLNPKTKKPVPLTEWTLRPYVDVGHELGWISRPAKSVADVLRDYRNYVHPEKERSHGLALNAHDARMFWQIAKSLTDQLLMSAKAGP